MIQSQEKPNIIIQRKEDWKLILGLGNRSWPIHVITRFIYKLEVELSAVSQDVPEQIRFCLVVMKL